MPAFVKRVNGGMPMPAHRMPSMPRPMAKSMTPPQPTASWSAFFTASTETTSMPSSKVTTVK